MGRDIHVVLEKKTADGWEFFNPGFAAYDRRYYSFFDFLEEVADPGCPPELDGRQLRLCSETIVDMDGETRTVEHFVWDTTAPRLMYGFGHITLERLVQEADRFNVTWVSAEFMELFERLGGVLPKGMHIASDMFDIDSVGIRVFDEDDIHLRDYIYAGIHDLSLIAAEHDLREDELRICFAFDC